MTDFSNRGFEKDEFAKDLAALARLVTYARQSSQALNIEFPTYCLDLALGAIMEEMQDIGVDTTRLMATEEFGIPAGFH